MYKTLLVPVDERQRSARSIELAGRLAREFDSHVVGLFVQPSPYIPGVAHLEGSRKLAEDLREKLVREPTQRAKAQFDACVRAAGIARAEWRTADGDRADELALHARYADLVIINQTDPQDVDASHFASAVLMSLGRPALLLPFVGEFSSVGNDVLVAWNATREAARAVTDALPLLRRARRVVVMAVDARPSLEGHGESPGADIAVFLARHGVKAEVAPIVSAGVDAGTVILSRAHDQGADLIVMGAYGHSRVRQIMLGGATRTVLHSMTLPVLMSH
jgi:nucleotide-binding universal stress UspA family protein